MGQWIVDTLLQDLHERLSRLERQVANLEASVLGRRSQESLGEQGGRLLREARASQAAVSAAVAKAFADMGIAGEPVSIDELRKMMEACGVKAEDRPFSREILAMREE